MSTTTSISVVLSLIQNFGLVLVGILPSILALLAALIGLYWGICALIKHIIGKEIRDDWLNSKKDRFLSQEEIKDNFPLM